MAGGANDAGHGVSQRTSDKVHCEEAGIVV
jgi:hypothetical protein